eukprot:PhM_4_TR8953/c0_g1_i1/m.10831
MFSSSRSLFRGYKPAFQPHGRVPKPSAKQLGGEPRVQRLHDIFYEESPGQRPLRAQLNHTPLPPVPVDRPGHIAHLEEILAPSRKKNQLRDTFNQLGRSFRNTDEYIAKHLFPSKDRPSCYDLWAEAVRTNQAHVLTSLPTYQAIPIVSCLSADFADGRMTLNEAEEAFSIMNSLLVHSDAAVKREVCNQMVRVYCIAGDGEKAMELVHQMRARRIRRNYITYAPLYRLARSLDNVDLHMAVQDMAYRLEGGLIGKAIKIDVPRLFGFPLVTIRYSWPFLVCVILIFTGLGLTLLGATLGIWQ